ncbi:hypothetical protein H2202_004386 [Exophiala xenobiotica]|nr:hypothetical protein H2202_004386 [Exophiala xenobiotica]
MPSSSASASALPSRSSIPSFYRIFFSTIDPLIALTGVLTNIFTPSMILKSYNSNATLPPSTETTVLLRSSAGYLLSTMFLQTVLLRLRPTDLTVWRCLQIAILIQDVVILASLTLALATQRRLNLALVRPEEWSNFVVLTAVGLIRAAFILDVGMPQAGDVPETGNEKGKGKKVL